MAIYSFGQNVPDSIYHHRLYYLCKAWGHAKYHHTGIASGTINWDDELFLAIHAAKYSLSDAGFNDTLQLIINHAGPMEHRSGTLPFVPDSLNNVLDYSWIQDPIFSDTVRALLDTIRSWFRPQYNVYVGSDGPFGNAIFSSDNQYWTEATYPDENKRLLALFRYWNIINYFAPYKNIMDHNWDSTLVDFIPQFAGAPDALTYNLAVKKLFKRIDDTHAWMFSAVYKDWVGRWYPPFYIRYIEDETVITKVIPGTADISPGDIVLAIDGVEIQQLRDSMRIYAYGSNDPVIEREINSMILWGPKGNSQVVLFDGENIDTVSFERNAENADNMWINNSPVWKDTVINGTCHIGIVDMGRLVVDDVDDMFSDLWETDAIIFDQRNFPNMTLWTIVNYLYNGAINISNYTFPDVTYPGTLMWHNEYIGSGTVNPYGGNIRILFNEETQSQAEFTCMGLEQHPGAIKIGSTTAGAQGNVSQIWLPGKISTYFSGLGIYYPDYTPTQRVGIIPDYEVHPTIEGIRNGEDELLAYALDCYVDVAEQKVSNPELSIYPNPCGDKVHFELSHYKDDGPLQFEIFDIYGRIIQKITEYSSTGEIDLTGFSSGAYFLKMTSNNMATVKKLVKE